MTTTRTLHCFKDIMPAKRQRRSGKRIVRRRQTRRNQRGGLFPLLALIPAAIAAGKAAALGAVSGAAGYGIKKALEGKKKKHIPSRYPTAVQDFAKRARREQQRRRKVIDFARREQRRLRALKKG